jgi:hypothetical protein
MLRSRLESQLQFRSCPIIPFPEEKMKSLREIGKFIMSEKVAAVKLWILSGGDDQAAKTQDVLEMSRSADRTCSDEVRATKKTT